MNVTFASLETRGAGFTSIGLLTIQGMFCIYFHKGQWRETSDKDLSIQRLTVDNATICI